MNRTEQGGLQAALKRARGDNEFRAHVVEDGREAQSEYGLTDREWNSLFNEVERIEHDLERDPLEATEVDHGEADAAASKG